MEAEGAEVDRVEVKRVVMVGVKEGRVEQALTSRSDPSRPAPTRGAHSPGCSAACRNEEGGLAAASSHKPRLRRSKVAPANAGAAAQYEHARHGAKVGGREGGAAPFEAPCSGRFSLSITCVRAMGRWPKQAWWRIEWNRSHPLNRCEGHGKS